MPDKAPGAGRTLLVAASAKEWAAVAQACGAPSSPPTVGVAVELAPGIDGLLTGVGKSAAAGALGWVLGRAPVDYARVINLGVCGKLPPCTEDDLGTLVVASRCVLADEGVALPDARAFVDLGALGFGCFADGTTGVQPSTAVADQLARLTGAARGVIATVSTCSGTDALTRAIVQRTGATHEAMEGAALALVCQRAGVDFAELRSVSNTCGDRTGQAWNLARALDALQQATRQVALCTPLR
jgi:futalosine hydrolase